MVSGDIQNYKTNKGYYSAPSTHAPSNVSSSAAKRFSDSALRPWPPMYRSPASRAQMATYQALSSASSTKLNYNNFNGAHYGYNNNNNNNSIYGRANKFNFHQFNMVAAASAIDNKYSTAMNLANMKNSKNYYLISQPQYVKNTLAMPSPPPSNGSNGSFYGRTTASNDYATNNGNMLLMAQQQDKDKNRFRRLRNPTQISQPFRSSSCATCIRSKSMEDVRTEIVTDWPTYNKENYNEFKKNRLNNNGAFGLGKHGVRRSMDNLLEVDTTNFGKRFQVRHIYHIICLLSSILQLFRRMLMSHISFSVVLLMNVLLLFNKFINKGNFNKLSHIIGMKNLLKDNNSWKKDLKTMCKEILETNISSHHTKRFKDMK